MRSAFPDFPGKAVGEYFLYSNCSDLVVATLLNRNERQA
jgi:hypothetical protein